MQIVVAGGLGQIAMLLHPLLKARGHQVRALIRNPDHADELRRVGAEPVLCETDLREGPGRSHDVDDRAGDV